MRTVSNLPSDTRSVVANSRSSFAGSPALRMSIVIVASGRSALSLARSRDGNARKTSSPRKTAMPAVPGTMRVAASAIVRPRSGFVAPASSISIASRAVTRSSRSARVARTVASPSASAMARPVARRSIDVSPVASSPRPTTRPFARRITETAFVSGSAAAESGASSGGRASRSSQPRATMNASIAVSSVGACAQAEDAAAMVVAAMQQMSATTGQHAVACCITRRNRPHRRTCAPGFRAKNRRSAPHGTFVATESPYAAQSRRHHN